MKKYIILLLLICPLLGFGQSDFCNKNFGNSYFPLEIGFEKNITWGSSFYVESIKEKTEIDGKEYFKYNQDFGNGKAYELLLRNQNDTIYLFNEKSKKDIVFLIAKAEKGLKWGTTKIIKTDANFETPYCNYENLLVVQYKYSNGEKGKRYYKKGLGLVAITDKKRINGVCLPNKEEAELLMKPFSYVECENEPDKAKIRECTMNAIQSYISNKLKSEKIKPPKEEGSLDFKVHISKTGEITDVKTLNSLAGGNQFRKRVVKIIKSLPKFNPTKTAEKKSVGTYLKLSVPIRIK